MKNIYYQEKQENLCANFFLTPQLSDLGWKNLEKWDLKLKHELKSFSCKILNITTLTPTKEKKKIKLILHKGVKS